MKANTMKPDTKAPIFKTLLACMSILITLVILSILLLPKGTIAVTETCVSIMAIGCIFLFPLGVAFAKEVL